MKSNINVINNAGKDVVVTVDSSKDGNTQIIIDLACNKVVLSSLEPENVFKSNNIEYIVLEQLGDETEVIRKEFLKETMEFDSDNNNWKTSSLRKFLNSEYLNEIEENFGKENIVLHSVDLLSLDGMDDYETSDDNVSLLTIDMYRKYRKVLGENMDNWWWLSTPDSTPTSGNSSYVQYVYSGGRVYCRDCRWSGGGVRPFFILKSDIFVSCDKTTE